MTPVPNEIKPHFFLGFSALSSALTLRAQNLAGRDRIGSRCSCRCFAVPPPSPGWVTPKPTLLPVPHHSTRKKPWHGQSCTPLWLLYWIFWKNPKWASQEPLSDVPAPRFPRITWFHEPKFVCLSIMSYIKSWPPGEPGALPGKDFPSLSTLPKPLSLLLLPIPWHV